MALGTPIGALQFQMTPAEFSSWVAYRRKRGPLNPMLRQEAGVALLATLICGAMGQRKEPADFMPWAKDDQPAGDDFNQVLGILRGAVSGK